MKPSPHDMKLARERVRRFLYLDPVTEAPLMICAKIQPSLESQPKSGTWIVREFYSGTCGTHKWDIPCFPEITWEVIKSLIFVGEIRRPVRRKKK